MINKRNRLPDPEILTENGWELYEACNCSGVLKQKYKNPAKGFEGLSIEWWVKMRRFSVVFRGLTLLKAAPIADLGFQLEKIKLEYSTELPELEGPFVYETKNTQTNVQKTKKKKKTGAVDERDGVQHY